jgi:hypothetical protein
MKNDSCSLYPYRASMVFTATKVRGHVGNSCLDEQNSLEIAKEIANLVSWK